MGRLSPIFSKHLSGIGACAGERGRACTQTPAKCLKVVARIKLAVVASVYSLLDLVHDTIFPKRLECRQLQHPSRIIMKGDLFQQYISQNGIFQAPWRPTARRQGQLYNSKHLYTDHAHIASVFFLRSCVCPACGTASDGESPVWVRNVSTGNRITPRWSMHKHSL